MEMVFSFIPSGPHVRGTLEPETPLETETAKNCNLYRRVHKQNVFCSNRQEKKNRIRGAT